MTRASLIARPEAAHWFQLIAARDDLPHAAALLATHHPIEPESLPTSRQSTTAGLLSPRLRESLKAFQQLSERYRPYWPDPADLDDPAAIAPLALLDQALEAIRAWQTETDPLITPLQTAIAAAADLDLWAELANHSGTGDLDFARLQTVPGGLLDRRLFVAPLTAPLESLDTPEYTGQPWLIAHRLGNQHRFLIAVAPPETMNQLAEAVTLARGRPLPLPAWFRGPARDNQLVVRRRQELCQEEIARLQEGIARCNQTHHLAFHLRAVNRLQWFFRHLTPVDAGEAFACLTGWTNTSDQETINQLLATSHSRSLFFISAPGPRFAGGARKQDGNGTAGAGGARSQDGNAEAESQPSNCGVAHPAMMKPEPPLILNNPPWAKPFELFPSLLGVPGRHEVDPSRLLPLIAPLLFGYMFGDLGQGVVLALAGWLLARRHPAGWLLVSGGVSAAFFGLLFGSLFCLEGVVHPWWRHPLADPLVILAWPLGFGVALILGGFALAAVEAHWREDLASWLDHQVGIVLLYLGLLLGFFHPLGWWLVAPAGLLWILLGLGRHRPPLKEYLTHLGHLPETLLQLGVNTLSFSRVGAFALAHAGLSQAVVALAELTDGGLGYGMVLLLGNLLVLLLEGLVVSVQTTRLILFEFFIRFLGGDGRPFRPLPLP